jgi:hypothetical protein
LTIIRSVCEVDADQILQVTRGVIGLITQVYTKSCIALDKPKMKMLGYVLSPLNQKISSKGSKTVDFALSFEMIIENVKIESQGLLKVRISMQNRRFQNPLNYFFLFEGL